MESKNKQREVRALLKDRRYYPASRELLRRFKKSGETRGSKEHVEGVVHMLKLNMRIMDEKAKKADQGFFHTCRDVLEWVWGTNKSFPGVPSSSLVRDWVHEKVKHKKPFPTVSITVSSEEDTDSGDDSKPASGAESDQEEDNREQTDSGR